MSKIKNIIVVFGIIFSFGFTANDVHNISVKAQKERLLIKKELVRQTEYWAVTKGINEVMEKVGEQAQSGYTVLWNGYCVELNNTWGYNTAQIAMDKIVNKLKKLGFKVDTPETSNIYNCFYFTVEW